MKEFERYQDAEDDLIENGYRELDDGEDYSDLIQCERWGIAVVHCKSNGMWTWCKKEDMKD
jgi:hypothetical protein